MRALKLKPLLLPPPSPALPEEPLLLLVPPGAPLLLSALPLPALLYLATKACGSSTASAWRVRRSMTGRMPADSSHACLLGSSATTEANSCSMHQPVQQQPGTQVRQGHEMRSISRALGSFRSDITMGSPMRCCNNSRTALWQAYAYDCQAHHSPSTKMSITAYGKPTLPYALPAKTLKPKPTSSTWHVRCCATEKSNTLAAVG